MNKPLKIKGRLRSSEKTNVSSDNHNKKKKSGRHKNPIITNMNNNKVS